jgi:hypothetical protein
MTIRLFALTTLGRFWRFRGLKTLRNIPTPCKDDGATVRLSRCPTYQPCRESKATGTTSRFGWPRLVSETPVSIRFLGITILLTMGKMFSAYRAIIGQAATTRLKSGWGGLRISHSVIKFCRMPGSGPKFIQVSGREMESPLDCRWESTVELRSLNSFYFQTSFSSWAWKLPFNVEYRTWSHWIQMPRRKLCRNWGWKGLMVWNQHSRAGKGVVFWTKSSM